MRILDAESVRFSSPEKHRSFHYYVSQGAELPLRYQPQSRPFLLGVALQLSHIHPSVKHAIIAMAAWQLHLRAISEANPQSDASEYILPRFAMIQYNKAIHSLTSRESNGNTLPVLLSCCLLFTAIESWVGKASILPSLDLLTACSKKDRLGKPYMLHVNAGLALIEEYHKAVEAGSQARLDIVDDLFEPIIRGLAVNLLTFNDVDPSHDNSISDNYALDHNLYVPSTFTDVPQAVQYMDELLKSVIRATSGTSPAKLSTRGKLQDLLPQLEVAMKQSTPEPSEKANAGLLRKYREVDVYRKLAKIMLDTFPKSCGQVYDGYQAGLEEILVDCQKLISMDDMGIGPISASFTIILGLITPLLLVATKCRDWPTRRQAIAALHSLVRVERHWNSCLATAIARFVLEKEGRLDAQTEAVDVLEARRIRIVSLMSHRAREQITIGFQ